MLSHPAEVFPPGDFIREELDARGWSQLDLARMLGRQPSVVSAIVNGKRAVTAPIAVALGEAFGTSPELWMNLESAYQLNRVRHDGSAVTRRAKLSRKSRRKSPGRLRKRALVH